MRKGGINMKLKYLPSKLDALCTDSKITKRVKIDYNTLTDCQFLRKYSVSKPVYAKRVLKYGDPYMNAPLAKIGKILLKIVKKS